MNKIENELLIRIDERSTETHELVKAMSETLNDNTRRINKHDLTLYGFNGTEGVFQKVERHDKAYLRIGAALAIMLFVFEMAKEYFIK